MYPLLLVLLLSSTVDVTVKVVLVPWSLVVLVEIVTERPDTEIQETPERSGENESVSVWLHPSCCVQAGIVKL